MKRMIMMMVMMVMLKLVRACLHFLQPEDELVALQPNLPVSHHDAHSHDDDDDDGYEHRDDGY